jgi:hypothetical protein
MKSPPSSSTASAIYTTIAHMRHAVATRFLDLPRQFIPWRREVLILGRQAEHRGRVHAVPLPREPHARVRTAGVLVDARMRKLLSIAKRELDVFAQLFPDAMPEAVPTWAQLQALARA